MRRLLLAAVMFGAGYSAQAADMPDFLRGSLSDGLDVTTRNWSGWYAGGQVGYQSTANDFSNSLVGLTNFIYRDSVLESPTSQLSALGSAHAQGTGFGGFVGRNWQWEDIVVGIETNYNYFNNLHASSNSSIGPLQFSFPPGQFTPANDTPSYTVTLNGNAAVQIQDAITFRGRAGWAVGDFLPYVFGGLAVGRMDVQRSVTSTTNRTDIISTTNAFGAVTTTMMTGPVASQSLTMSQQRVNDFVVGWTGGLGVEYAVWNNLFVRAEWEYIRFVSVMNMNVEMNSAHVGIGYKF
jgi:outer membrane immunogenic protein